VSVRRRSTRSFLLFSPRHKNVRVYLDQLYPVRHPHPLRRLRTLRGCNRWQRPLPFVAGTPGWRSMPLRNLLRLSFLQFAWLNDLRRLSRRESTPSGLSANSLYQSMLPMPLRRRSRTSSLREADGARFRSELVFFCRDKFGVASFAFQGEEREDRIARFVFNH